MFSNDVKTGKKTCNVIGDVGTLHVVIRKGVGRGAVLIAHTSLNISRAATRTIKNHSQENSFNWL